ncbi:MAG: biopolymer transporter ExbD [Verrucomicrobiales bacterium]|nr:biopolymer transporter ExbD [Verrucomicrobiales bacterium]
MIYTAPLADVVLLLIIFFLFGSSLVLKSGVGVNLPRSSSALPVAEEAHIITLLSEDISTFYFNDQKSDLKSLETLLDEGAERSRQVILLGDESIPYGKIMEISEIILQKGFELAFATQERAL